MSDSPSEKRRSQDCARRSVQKGVLSVSEQCELLASARRRAVLRYLRAWPEETVAIDDLIEHLLAEEVATDRQNIRISLEYVHLPKLANMGVITYNTDRGYLQYQPHDRLEHLLTFLEEA